MTKIRKTKKSNVAKDVEQLEFSYITGISTKWCNQENLWQPLINVNTYLSYNPTISILCIYERQKKTYVRKKTWIDVHVRNLDWTKCLLIGYWINSMWCII